MQSGHSVMIKLNKTSWLRSLWIRFFLPKVTCFCSHKLTVLSLLFLFVSNKDSRSLSVFQNTYSQSWWAHLVSEVLRALRMLRSGSAGPVRGWAEPSRSDPDQRRQSCCLPDRGSAPALQLRNRAGRKESETLSSRLQCLLFFWPPAASFDITGKAEELQIS